MDVQVLDSEEEEDSQDRPAETAPPATKVGHCFLRTALNFVGDVMFQPLFALTNVPIDELSPMQARTRVR